MDSNAQVIGRGRSDAQGAYLFRIRIPESTSSGPHTVIVKTRGRQYERTIEVVDGSAGAGLNATAAPMLAAWVALAGVMAAFFVGSRRRRRPALAVATASHEVPLMDTSGFVPSRPRRRSATPTPTAKRSSKRKAPAKTGRSGSVTTKRGGPKAPQQRAGKAKPKQQSKDADKGTQA